MIDSTYSDEYLLRMLSSGERLAFTLLFERYWDKVYSTSLILSKSAELAQDIAQEVFLKLWQNHPEAASIQNLESFLFVASRNLIYNKMSRLKLEDAYRSYVKYRLTGATAEPAFPAGARELLEVLEAGVRQLPPQQQKAFRLSREQGLSHEEIAVQLGVTKASVKDYIVRAIAFLRKYLQEHAAIFVLLFRFLFD